MKKILALTTLLLIFSVTQLFAVTISNDTVSGVDRYAVYVGCNYGGKSRERLLYAGSDAQSFKVAMAEIGGVTEENSRILFDPTKETVDKALADITAAINSNTNNSKRSEFIFYYSGHSDENALLLGDAKYDYSKLKAAITAVPSDIHVVILDSCYSGNFIRTKGGQKRKPFLIDDSSVVTGHAYLSSSSDNESSQESDEIESSYFTNAMITGLRGAADTSGDNKVTLNELYSYAFNDTLSKTESSKAGPQHPNYNITLVGSGDLILSDLTTAEAMLSLSKEAKGRFIIRDANDKLISEINKSQGQPIFMALPSGQYSALIIDEYSTKQGTFILEKDQVYVLDQNSLSSIKRKNNRLRGDSVEEKAEEAAAAEETDDEEFLSLDDLEETKENKKNTYLQEKEEAEKEEATVESEAEDLGTDPDLETLVPNKKRMTFYYDEATPFNLQFVPNVYFVEGDAENTLFSVGIVGSKAKNIGALQYSSIFNIASGDLFGGQIAGIFNIETGRVNGAQTAGIFNIAKDIAGGQVAGLFNISRYMAGTQVSGLMNVSSVIFGSQITGFVNVAKHVDGLQLSGFANYAQKVNGAQIGIVNYAEENEGITLGLFNYVDKGLHDMCVAYDSTECIDIFYQGGSRGLYTTFGFARPAEKFFEDGGFGIAYFGLGSELKFPRTSLDFECLWKMVYYDELEAELEELEKEYDKASMEDKIYSLSIPSFKVTWNIFESDSSRLFFATSFDINVPNWNDYAFKIYNHPWSVDMGDYIVCPVISFGWKVKI